MTPSTLLDLARAKAAHDCNDTHGRTRYERRDDGRFTATS